MNTNATRSTKGERVMNESQEAAYIMGMAVGGLIEAFGMMSDNMQRHYKGEAMAYDEKAFYKLMEDRGLHNNAIVSFFQE